MNNIIGLFIFALLVAGVLYFVLSKKKKPAIQEDEEVSGIEEEPFAKGLAFVLKWEGVVSNDINDPGGLTIYGISYRSHPTEVMTMKELMDKGKRNEALEIAKKIYYNHYWLGAECDRHFYPYNILLFDTGVNMGISAAKQLFDVSDSLEDYLFNRLDRYTKMTVAQHYMRGWCNRVISLWKLLKKKGDE